MIGLARKNNCRILFLYLPESGSGLSESMLHTYYEIIAPVILPNDSTINNPNNWMDEMHFNANGAKEVSQQLVDYFLSSGLNKAP